MTEEKRRRPIYDVITKVNVNKDDAEILLNWSLQASAAEGKPVSTREIVRRLISEWSTENGSNYPKRNLESS